MPTVQELREQLRLRGLPTWGNKQKLHDRLEMVVRDCPGEMPKELGGNNQTPSFVTNKWVITWNNYPGDVRGRLEKLVPFCKNYVFGWEKGESGTPHIQGAFITKTKISFEKLCEILGSRAIHAEKMKGKWEDQKYCKKDGEYITSDQRIVHPVMDRWWQKEILEQIKLPPDDRTIRWYWSHKGNMGKTTFCKYLTAIHDAIPLGGKAHDVRNGVAKFVEKNKGRTPELVVVPIPRSFNSTYVSYEAIENIKDMYFYSGKFEGGAVCGPCPHLYVFANHPPDEDKMSSDRWEITCIDKDDEDVIVSFE